MVNKDIEIYRDKVLMVICPSYPDKKIKMVGGIFVKEQVDILKNFFKKVLVIVPLPHGIKGRLYIQKRYQYDNVVVYYIRYPHLPTQYYRAIQGENCYKSISKKINYKNNVDILHAHFTWPTGYSAMRIKEEYGIPAILTVHEDQQWFLREVTSNDSKIYKTWSKMDAIIRVNRIDIQHLKKFNKNVYYIPNGYNPNRIFPMKKDLARKKLNIGLNKRVIFSIGKLEPRKGYLYLIDAMNIISKKYSDILCIIGGEGKYNKYLKRYIKHLNLQNKVILTGFISNEDLNYYYNAADLFVIPSLSEGNPTVMFEALGTGLPVIGTNVGGIPEIISNDRFGFIVKPGDPIDLADKIDIALNRKWNKKDILLYGEQFKWDNIALKIMDVYVKHS